MTENHVPAEFRKDAFHCPLCGVYANQIWDSWHLRYEGKFLSDDVEAAGCQHCNDYSVWHKMEMVRPDVVTVSPPNEDLSEDIKNDYREAAAIFNKSPRGATALLRLSIQKLCKELGEDGKNINNDIKNLVARGLPSMVQQSLDVVRVIGNEAVHPGQIDVNDNPETAKVLFKLINLIAEKMITEPKEVQDIYDSLPDEKRHQIRERDGITSQDQ